MLVVFAAPAFAPAATQRVQQPQIVFCNSHDVHPGGKSTNKARPAPTPRGTRNKTQTPTHERTGARTLARIHTCYTWTIARPPTAPPALSRASRPVRSRAHTSRPSGVTELRQERRAGRGGNAAASTENLSPSCGPSIHVRHHKEYLETRARNVPLRETSGNEHAEQRAAGARA